MSSSLEASLNREPVLACAICGSHELTHAGSKDFGVCGSDHFEGRRVFANQGVDIAYQACGACGFIFTSAFDDWTPAHWREHVYNDDYVLADPPFVSERPARNAQMLLALFHRELPEISILDIGGGRGLMAQAMREAGAQIKTSDPFFGDGELKNDERFDLITSFEVIEHVTHGQQHAWLQGLARHLKHHPYSRLLVSTEVRQSRQDIGWWYICPRNGHISIHTANSLTILAQTAGLKVFSINPSMHLLSSA